jgi:hypothetical protein
MRKSKNQRDTESINTLKEKFEYLDTETIARRLMNFSLSNNISIAYKQILRNRGIDDYWLVLHKQPN